MPSARRKEPAPDDHDNPWKEAILGAFPEFMAFFFPAAHAAVDWSRPPVFLDKELRKVARDAASGKRYVDILASAAGHDGARHVLYIHVEVQSQRDEGFARRMFTYNHRLVDRWGQAVASFAVLADAEPGWRPVEYRLESLGCEHRLRFPAVKLLDLEARLEELHREANPFALVTAAHLSALRTQGDATRRFAAKRRLVRLLYQRGWSRQRVLELFVVIDWMLRLPEPMEAELWQDIARHERKVAMRYVTTIERLAIQRGLQKGIEKGIEQGIDKGRAVTLGRLLARRFGPLPSALQSRLDAATPAQLDTWTDRLLDAPTLQAVFEPH